jgi:glycosyltransferase involved in cell wall biosynthesis
LAPRIAILADSLAGWTGGIDFLRLCVGALNSASPNETWTVLTPTKNLKQTVSVLGKNGIEALLGRRLSPFPHTPKRELTDAFALSGAVTELVDFRNTPRGLSKALLDCQADTVFPCEISLGSSFPVPWIGYIPDLQHKRLPHWFSERERSGRDKKFKRILSDATAVLVNAAAVIEDIQEFYPHHRARLFALPFCPPPNAMDFLRTLKQDIRRSYELPEHYFVISNQFWIHKSHETAFLALRKVIDAGFDVHIVCTGKTADYRWPDHFMKLLQLIESTRLGSYVHILGLLPKIEQLGIMRGSIAVIQPTLFEGGPGGGAVYDAISINTPAIVSDIPVNREIDMGSVRYFTAASPDDLADKMIAFLMNRPKMVTDEELSSQLKHREQEFGSMLLGVAASVRNPRWSPAFQV